MAIEIKVYRSGAEWFASRWIDGEYDGCDPMDIPSETTEVEALAAARSMTLVVEGDRTVTRVPDVDADGHEIA